MDTPAFVVDQDPKGLLGRLMRAYGPANASLQRTRRRLLTWQQGGTITRFLDAIWGYTQFMIDDATRKVLVICTRSG